MKYILTVLFSLFFSFSALAFEMDKPIAKDFTAPAMDGKIINLNQQRGKVVVLTFWSTTCPICAGELPKLNQVVNKNAGKDVVFLALTMEHESRVSAYLQKRQLNSIIIPNALGVFMDYSPKDRNGNYSMGYPSYFVINQKGEIEMTASGRGKTDAVNSNVNRLLSGN